MAVKKSLVIHHPLRPVYDERARVLILGSMPGSASLQAGEYYAHPRNQFWDIMGTLVGAKRELLYSKRLAVLCRNRIALWDVISSCERSGSLDAAIVARSVHVHSLRDLRSACPKLTAIYFNGRAAETYFFRHVHAAQPAEYTGIKLTALPSTSPANASLSLNEKIEQWRQIKTDIVS